MDLFDLCEKLLMRERLRVAEEKKAALAKGWKIQPEGCEKAISDIDASIHVIRMARGRTDDPGNMVPWLWAKEKRDRNIDNRWYSDEIKRLNRKIGALRGVISRQKNSNRPRPIAAHPSKPPSVDLRLPPGAERVQAMTVISRTPDKP